MDEYDRIARKSLEADDLETRPDENKLAELLLLVAEELAEDRFGGATKVNKVLFFAEFAHVRQTGRPITGVAYQKLPHGPAPRRLRPVRDRLVVDGDAELVAEPRLGYTQHRLRPLRPADRSRFSPTELATVADAVALLFGRTGSDVSDLSHTEPGWQMVNEGEDIPYVTAYLDIRRRTPSPRVLARAAAIAEKYAERGQLAR